MLRVLLSLTALLISISNLCFASDVSMYMKRSNGETSKPILWGTTTFGDRIFGEARANFDAGNTAGVFFGKSFGGAILSATPAIGLLTGEYNALSVETYLNWSPTKKISLMKLLQYAGNTDGRKDDFVYQYLEAMTKVNDWLQIGAGEQLYHELASGFKTQFDLGPTAKINLGSWYLKPWIFWRLTHDNQLAVMIGLGKAIGK